MDSGGVIRLIIERSDDGSSEQVDPPESDDEDGSLAQAIALSLTSPDGTTRVVAGAKAKCARVVRFNLPLLDPPPRVVPVIPRLRPQRFRPPPAPTSPKPGPPPPPTREQRMSATMRFYQSTGQRPVTPHLAPAPIRSQDSNHGTSPVLPVLASGPPEVTPEPCSEPSESDAESFIFDSSS